MRTHRITDHDAEALLRGRSPHARTELSPLADAVAELRTSSSSGMPPRPSAAVASRLDLDLVSAVGFVPADDPDATAPTPAPSARRRRVVTEWFAGLGLATKIAIGASAALAVGATGAGAAGAAGVLPEPAQVVFEEMTGTDAADVADVAETEEIADEGERTTGLEHAEEQAGSGLEVAVEHADEHAEQGLETAEENAGHGIGTGDEASEGAGAPEGKGAPEGAGDQASNADDRPTGGKD
ncbi:hypothetical protein [Agromyces sp. SYSU T0242]|uniref:hypothetical protein n=1 Tax=Agromyces litoreus TaxID=3158561 RepID=UPI003391B258